MVESKQTSPHVHTVFKVDMTRIVRLREKEKSKYEQRNGVKLTYMPFIMRAAIVALRKHPIVNGSIEGDAIRYNTHINIGIAVALDWGRNQATVAVSALLTPYPQYSALNQSLTAGPATITSRCKSR